MDTVEADSTSQQASDLEQSTYSAGMGDNTDDAAQQVAVTKSVRDALAAASDLNNVQPPSETEHINILDQIGNKLKTQLNVTDEGTVVLDLDDPSAELSTVLKPVLDHHVGRRASVKYASRFIPPAFKKSPRSLNIVVHIVGSRGDVQPFVSIGKVLKETYHHRVRIATHLLFKKFVEDSGLEFFNIGGDPAELMSYMVRNPGLVPDFHTLTSGDVGKRRTSMYEIVNGCWRSCIEPGDGTGPEPEMGHYPYHYQEVEPFIADAIIANPPSFAHVHCAEKLGIPLHLMFTMPWSPTQSFPHPLVNIRTTNANPDMTNYISYTLVDMMTWQGLGDIINRFRRKALNLEPVSVMWAPGMTHRLRIPFTYCWSPALIPKPKDWADHISISGFYFLSLASAYTPDPALLEFLNAGPPPVYIGFGSIVVDDPDAMTRLIFKAVKLSGTRALVSQGWGGLGAHEIGKPDEVFMLGNIPHDWLFKHVSAVVHHGGAGTTAAGVLAGRPTVIVPFFGDQPFWGSMIARAGAGPEPIPYKKLTAESLAEQIKIALAPETLVRAKELGQKMAAEEGAAVGAKHFHEFLDPNMQCSIIPGRAAVWRLRKTNVLLSAKAAAILCMKQMFSEHDLKLHRSIEYETENGPWDPVSGVASVLVGTLGTLAVGAADLPAEVFHKLKTTAAHRNSLKVDGQLARDESKKHVKTAAQAAVEVEDKPTHAVDTAVTAPQEYQTDHQDDANPPNDEIVKGSDASIADGASSIGSDTTVGGPKAPSIAESHPHLSEATITRLTNHSDSIEKSHMQQKHQEVKNGLVHAAKLGLTVPMDFADSLAQGFHNAPRLYGDHTVRPVENITGFQSGLKAAGMGLTHGIYDGVTGVVTQPFNGAKHDGVAGFMAGVVKGVGGLVLKPTGAVFSVPANTIKGVYKELQRTGDTRLEEHIIKSRIIQGSREAIFATEEEKNQVVERWTVLKFEATEKDPRLNRAQTFIRDLNWKLYGDGKNGDHSPELDGTKSETGSIGHKHGRWHLPSRHKKDDGPAQVSIKAQLHDLAVADEVSHRKSDKETTSVKEPSQAAADVTAGVVPPNSEATH